MKQKISSNDEFWKKILFIWITYHSCTSITPSVWRKRNERVQATAAGSKDLADERLQITVTIAIWQGFESFLLQNHRSLFTVCQRAIQ